MGSNVSCMSDTEQENKRNLSLFWRVIAPTILILVFWWTQALYGFHPSDDGFILAQSWRLTHGEIPHVDFTSPRPLGSAFIHAPIALLPVGMLAASRLFVVFQFYWIAKMSTKIAFKQFELDKTYTGFCLTAIAFLFNVGTWPIMAWHTIDGIFLGVTAIAMAKTNIEKSHVRIQHWVVPLLLAGTAPLIKQGFAVVPIVMLLLVVASKMKPLIPLTGLMLLPGAAFMTLTIRTPGGLLSQLHSGSKRELIEPLNVFLSGLKSAGLGSLSTVLILVLLGVVIVAKKNPKLALYGSILSIACAVYLSGAQDFSMSNYWANFFVLVVSVCLLAFCRKVLDIILYGSLLSLASAASLSWGVPYPSLLGGSLLIASIGLLAEKNYNFLITKPSFKFVLNLVLGLAVICTSAFVTQARSRNVYNEPRRELLTASVDMPQFMLIKMSANSAEYLKSIRSCLSQFPAATLAVLPDGPGIYPFFNKTNPFDSDWWLTAERVPDKEHRDFATVQELNERDDWLVLVQSYSVFDLARISREDVNVKREMVFYDSADMGVFNSLDGELISCNSFTGKYRPNGT